MPLPDTRLKIEERLGTLPLIDAHTHLIGGALGARGLHDIMLYHMAVSELYSAGYPSGARLTQYPGRPDETERRARIEEALPYLPMVRATSTSWAIRTILADLYDWHEPVTTRTWEDIDALIRSRTDDRAWHREILRRAGVEAACTELARRGEGIDDDIFAYSLEWAFFTRCQWGEYDTALYELERCWGRTPESPTPIGGSTRPRTERTIVTMDDVHDAIGWYVDHIPADRIVSVATHLSTDIEYRVVSPVEMAGALSRRGRATGADRDIYACYINELFLNEFERRYGDSVTFQFSFGAEPLPYETASRVSQRTIAQLAEMVARHPGLKFQCFLSSAHANQSLCTLCRELPNLSLAGYWWHNFFPSVIKRVIEERLDMLPINRQVGFFSDAYCVEWVYGKAMLVRKMMASVLAERVELGQFSLEEATTVAGELLAGTARTLIGIRR